VKYARPPFPPALYTRFVTLAKKLGYTVPGHKWRLLEILLELAEQQPNAFRAR
jgi:hypothetical protein